MGDGPAWTTWVLCQRGSGGWCAKVSGVGGILKAVALVILEEILG